MSDRKAYAIGVGRSGQRGTMAEHRRLLDALDPNDLAAIDAWCEIADRIRRQEQAGQRIVPRGPGPVAPIIGES